MPDFDKDGRTVGNSTEDIRTADVYLEDLLAVANGADEDGMPNCSAAITLFTWRDGVDPDAVKGGVSAAVLAGQQSEDELTGIDDGIEDEDVCSFRDAVFEFYCYGGTLVMEASFPSDAAFELRRISRIIQEWMPRQEDFEYRKTHQLHVTIFPMNLEGEVTLDFQELLYATLFRDVKPNTWKMVLVFHISIDDGSAMIIESETINREQIYEAIELERAREKNQLDNEYAEVMEELREAENYNPYEEAIQEQYGDVAFDPMQDNRGQRLREASEDDDDDEDEYEDEEETSEDKEHFRHNDWMRFTDD